jgi:multiple sugar transport system permease protein
MSTAIVPTPSTGRGKRFLNRTLRPWREATRGERVFFAFAYIIASAFAIISLFPLYWMVTTAIKPPTSIMSLPPQWIPTSFTLDNFREAFANNPVLRWTFNSIIVAGSVTAFQLIFATMAGYGFAKKDFPGKEILFWLYISSMMVPSFAIIIPLFTLMADYGLVDSYLGLIAPGLSAPFGVFLMRQFVQSLPTELIDAAKIDGCGELRIFWDIILPLAKPGLAVLGIFVFMGQWSAFLWPLIITNSHDMRTLMVGFALLANRELRVNYGAMMAAATYMALPMLVVFFAFQRYFLRGITIGGIKG